MNLEEYNSYSDVHYYNAGKNSLERPEAINEADWKKLLDRIVKIEVSKTKTIKGDRLVNILIRRTSKQPALVYNGYILPGGTRLITLDEMLVWIYVNLETLDSSDRVTFGLALTYEDGKTLK